MNKVPYIKKEKRSKFKPIIQQLENGLVTIENPGELNYIITNICLHYLIHNGIKFENLNSISGVLDTVWSEIDKRILAPYEYSKKIKNGDLDLYIIINEILNKK